MSNNQNQNIIRVSKNTVIYQKFRNISIPYMPIQHLVSVDEDWLITFYLGQIVDNKYHGQCICRIRHQYDEKENRIYYFDNSLYENGEIKNDFNCRSIMFYGKSLLKKILKQKKGDGTNNNYIFNMNQDAKKKNIIVQDEPSHEKIVEEQQVNNVWTKYDQVFYQKDLQILNSTQWLGSNILDAYACKLNKENVQQFVKSKNPNEFNRFFCIPSYIYTQTISENNREYQKIDSLKSLLLEVSLINSLFFEIYQTVVIIINQNNAHWFCVELSYSFEEKQLSFIIYDSMSGRKNQYWSYCENIRMLLIDSNLCHTEVKKVQLQDISVQQVHQQGNGYACGDNTYNNLKKIYHKSLGEGVDFKDGSAINNVRKELRQVIKY